MRFHAYMLLTFILAISMTACIAQESKRAAELTLEEYLDSLHKGEYEQATLLF